MNNEFASQHNRKKTRWQHGLLAFAVLAFFSCENANPPLDAEPRQSIDSTATAEINKKRVELDSICKINEKNQLPLLVDSIKKVRLREIKEQLKTVPK